MSHRQEVMSLIMNGFDSAIEVQTIDGNRTTINTINTFIYQGDYFEAFADFGTIKSVQRIPLINIKDFRILEDRYEIVYDDWLVINLIKKKA